MMKYYDQWDSQGVKVSVSSFEPIFCDSNNKNRLEEPEHSQDNGKIIGSKFVPATDQNLVQVVILFFFQLVTFLVKTVFSGWNVKQ